MKYFNLNKMIYLLKILFLITQINCFIPHSNFIIHQEQQVFNAILYDNNIPCHLQSVRIKTFESAIEKMHRFYGLNNINVPNNQYRLIGMNIYNIHDLIGFRYVFYTKEDLLKFYHHIRLEKNVMYSKK